MTAGQEDEGEGNCRVFVFELLLSPLLSVNQKIGEVKRRGRGEGGGENGVSDFAPLGLGHRRHRRRRRN